jgi:hypothetical protein
MTTSCVCCPAACTLDATRPLLFRPFLLLLLTSNAVQGQRRYPGCARPEPPESEYIGPEFLLPVAAVGARRHSGAAGAASTTGATAAKDRGRCYGHHPNCYCQPKKHFFAPARVRRLRAWQSASTTTRIPRLPQLSPSGGLALRHAPRHETTTPCTRRPLKEQQRAGATAS